MLARMLDLAIAQFAATVRGRVRDAVRQALLDGTRDALLDAELKMEIEATLVESAAVRPNGEARSARPRAGHAKL